MAIYNWPITLDVSNQELVKFIIPEFSVPLPNLATTALWAWSAVPKRMNKRPLNTLLKQISGKVYLVFVVVEYHDPLKDKKEQPEVLPCGCV